MEPDISSLAALLAEPACSRILMALADGRGLPATELARRAGVTPQTASSHLSKLTEGHLLQLIPQGRHRYYRLANSRVAEFLESMAAIAPLQTGRALGPDQGSALQLARSCYKHLAGSLGVGITKALVERKILREEGRDYEVTRSGAAWFEDFGIDTNALRKSGRVFARQCLDWSERRNHLAGALGTALTERLFELEWIKPIASRPRDPGDCAGKNRAQTPLWTEVGIEPVTEEAVASEMRPYPKRKRHHFGRGRSPS